MAAFEVPTFITKDLEGNFISLINEVNQSADLKMNMNVYPPSRAFKMFELGELEGFFPYVFARNIEKALKSEPFYYKKEYLFALEDSKPKKKKQKVCLTLGYFYDKKILEAKEYEIIYTHSDESCFRMLASARVDGMVCELATGLLTLNKLDISNIKIRGSVLASNAVGVGFLNDEKGKEALVRFDKALISLKSDQKKYLLYFKDAVDLANKYHIDFNPIEP